MYLAIGKKEKKFEVTQYLLGAKKNGLKMSYHVGLSTHSNKKHYR